MGFKVENQQMLKGKCTACSAEVRWTRPRGCSVFIGVFAKSDGLEFEPAQVSGGEIIVTLTGGARLHLCHQRAGTKKGDEYIDRFTKWLSGDASIMGPPKAVRRKRGTKRTATADPEPEQHVDATPAELAGEPSTAPEFKPGEVSEKRKWASAEPGGTVADLEAQLAAAREAEAARIAAEIAARAVEEAAALERAKAEAAKPMDTAEKLLPKLAHRQWWRIEQAVKHSTRPVVIAGPPATGKTRYAEEVGKRDGALVIQQTMLEEMPASDLIGTQTLVNGSFQWQDGPLLRAWKESHKRKVILVLNEIDHISPDCATAAHLALDDVAVASFFNPHTGETIRPHAENFKVIVTTNTELTGLPVGVQDRCVLECRADYPNPGLVDSLTTVAARRLVCSEAREYSIRAVLAWDEMQRRGLDTEEAAQIVFGDENARSLMDAIKIDAASR